MASQLQRLLLAWSTVNVLAVREDANDGSPDVADSAAPGGLSLPAWASSLVAMNSSHGVWHCTGACVECDDGNGGPGVAWRIGRSQPTGRKIAKAVGIGAVATLVSLTGGLAGAVGGLVLGGVTFFGGSASLLLAGGGIGFAHLLSNRDERACPIVTFEEKLPENAGFIKGVAASIKGLWQTAMKQDHDEQSFTLDDINYQELLLRVKQDGKAYLKGDRQDMPEEDRLRMTLACNTLTFDMKEWLEEDAEAQAKRNKDANKKEIEERQMAIVKECGQWLCAGKEVAKAFSTGPLTKCGGRTHVMKNLIGH